MRRRIITFEERPNTSERNLQRASVHSCLGGGNPSDIYLWCGEEVEEEEREGAARIVPGRRGEGARKRGGENTRKKCYLLLSATPPPMALRHQDTAKGSSNERVFMNES